MTDAAMQDTHTSPESTTHRCGTAGRTLPGIASHRKADLPSTTNPSVSPRIGGDGVERIVAKPVPWRSTPGSRLLWDAIGPGGEVLFERTEYPFADGAHVLLSLGYDPDALVTMRHEGAAHDSFRPVLLRRIAAVGAKRAAAREKLRAAFAGARP